MDIKYIRIKIDNESNKNYLGQLVALSKEWELENSFPSYNANDNDYFINKELFLAIDGTQVIGYALGEIKELQEDTSYNKIGEKAFELDELYVTQAYRNQKVGRSLYEYLESDVKDQVDVIGVIATSFKYEALLKFYIQDLGMSFNHALLVKRT